jgi:hypothetical protein
MAERYLTTEELADRLRRTPGTLANWRLVGKGPKFLRPAGNKRGRILYRLEEVELWETQSLRQETGERHETGR